MEKIKLLLYCTKSKPQIFYEPSLDKPFVCGYEKVKNKQLNGKIVAECDFEVEEIEYIHIKERDEIGILHNAVWYEYKGKNIWLSECDLSIKSCLTADEIDDYLINKSGYAIKIKNLHIFDKPRELNFYHNAELDICLLKNAPQNMMYVYDYKGIKKENGIYKNIFEKYILISIRPEWLCKILNGEKTIEVRKKVLKEML